MKASAYIQKLQDLIDRHGDLECVDANDTLISEPEFSNDTGIGAFILADRG